jgi:hypothetical protein
MAIFSAIATAIVGKVFAATIIGKIVVGLIATGLAIGTAKLLGVYEKPASLAGQKDPGVKIQVPPATDNKIPRLYGRNYTGSIIFDAEISNQNKTMNYAMVISEYNDGDTWTINDIYRDDARLLFSGATVTGAEDANETTATNISGKIRVRVYAGGSAAANQIFPVGDAQNAYDIMPGWTSNHTMEDLVFAVFQMDYDSENGLTGLSAITFDINNSVNNPANVLLDYLRNDRYGAGLANTYIDTTSFDDWRDYSNQLVNYTDTANVTQQHSRYQIDGAISTFASVKENINKICLSGGAFFTYNNKLGKFGVVPSRAVSNTYLANAFVFSDDNIVSSINIGSTELFSLYNAIEIEYPSVNQRDQTDVYYAELSPAVLNPNEPYNKLDYRLEMVNDGSRVAQLANIDLNQSRFNTILTFTADFSAMQVDVGDVVKVNSELYGYVDKLFRVMRVTEKEDTEGVITVDLTLLEYSSSVYDDLIGVEDLPKPVTGISNWWLTNGNASITLGNVIIVNDPLAANANVHSPTTGNVVSTLPMANVRADYATMFSNTSTFINIPINIPPNVNFNTARVVVVNQTANVNATPLYYTQGPSDANSYFEPNTTFNFGINTFEFDRDTAFRMDVDMFDSVSGVSSLTFTTGTFQVGAVAPSNVIQAPIMAPGAAGVNFVEVLPLINLPANAITNPANLVPATDEGWIYANILLYSYPTAEVKGNIETWITNPASSNINTMFGTTDTAFVGTYSVLTTCAFTGQTTTANVASIYKIYCGVDYPGNIANTVSLVANVDYVTNQTHIQPNNLALSTPVLTVSGNANVGNVYSSLSYSAGRSQYGEDTPTTIILSFPFKIYPTAKLFQVFAEGGTTVEQTLAGQRGFSNFFTISAANKGYFEAANAEIYPKVFD